MQPDQRAARRQFLRVFLVASLVFVGFVFLSDFVVDANPDSNWRYIVALLPVAPIAAWVFASVRYHRLLDELQQRIQLEAMAFAFTGTAVITAGYGFLEFAGLPRIGWVWVWPLMGGLWFVTDWLVRQRRL
ncbi:MAG: hypothetical protein F4Y97_00595 [Dehalococcoidia bacterium]|nr:hypothetical protein [Dehalococcoidia bacterium]